MSCNNLCVELLGLEISIRKFEGGERIGGNLRGDLLVHEEKET